MPLTPEDVRNKRFTPVRLREGYDMGEVDQFLDEVESELDRLTQENEGLRSRLGGVPGSQPTEERGQAAPASESDAASVQDEVSPSTGPSQAHAPSAESAPVTTIGQAAGAAARLLELATRNADEVMAEAQEEADRILAEARTKADRVESDARSRAEKLDVETAERRQQLFGDLEKDRDQLSREVEHLRSFEREYRSRLRAYFTDQLSQLEGEQSVAAPQSDGEPEHSPRRLHSLLGDTDNQNQQG